MVDKDCRKVPTGEELTAAAADDGDARGETEPNVDSDILCAEDPKDTVGGKAVLKCTTKVSKIAMTSIR